MGRNLAAVFLALAAACGDADKTTCQIAADCGAPCGCERRRLSTDAVDASPAAAATRRAVRRAARACDGAVDAAAS